ncbi:hypothetical protein HF086_017354 [Spodoptera exigua]|uniref:Uncharacterized protein n=1 Tax=Spodoptera exigua TaxID=7107 RepID=A0A922S8J3_SPOEX|nr:hypothetical protein HF086_017354 [Spodoptera exigua]
MDKNFLSNTPEDDDAQLNTFKKRRAGHKGKTLIEDIVGVSDEQLKEREQFDSEYQNQLALAMQLMRDNRADLLQTLEEKHKQNHVDIKSNKPAQNQTSTSRSPSCPLCKAQHYLFSCPDFKQMTVEKKNRKGFQNECVLQLFISRT